MKQPVATQPQDDNAGSETAEVLQKIEEEHTSEGQVGGELHLQFRVRKGEDEYGQTRVVWRKKKDLDCGSHMATKVQEEVFRSYEDLVSWLEEQWFDAVVADSLAEDFGDEVGFEAEDIMYPVDRMARRLHREMDISKRVARKMAIEWMQEEYPEHFADSEEGGDEE